MIETMAAWVEASGPAVYAFAPLFTVLVAVLPIPAEIPAMLNGMVFGPIWGTLVTWVSLPRFACFCATTGRWI